MPITENVDSDVNGGCGMIGRDRMPDRIALGYSGRGSSMRSGTTSRRAIRKDECEYCNTGTGDSVTHGEGLRVFRILYRLRDRKRYSKVHSPKSFGWNNESVRWD